MTDRRPTRRRRRASSLLSATVAVLGLTAAALATAGPAGAATGGPVPADDAYSTDYETTLTVPAAAGLFANDDPGYETDLHVGLYDPSTVQGTLTLDGEDGSFDFTPAPGFYGVTSFVYRLGDTDHYSPSATVSFTVRPVGSRDDAYRLAVNTPTLSVPAPGVYGNDVSASDVTTVHLVTAPSHGTISLSIDGSFTYTPTPRYAGTDTFTYVVVEASGTTSSPATVTITVDPPNADLGVTATAVGAPRAGSTFTLRVVLVGTGPSQAPNVVVGVDVGPGLTVTAAPGGQIAKGARTVGYAIPLLRVGASRSLNLTVAVPAGVAAARRTLTVAVRSLTVPDMVPANDRAQVAVRTRVPA